jgi:hypothetical protein
MTRSRFGLFATGDNGAPLTDDEPTQITTPVRCTKCNCVLRPDEAASVGPPECTECWTSRVSLRAERAAAE